MIEKLLNLLGYTFLPKEDNEFFEETIDILEWIEDLRVKPFTLEAAADELAECVNCMADDYAEFDPILFRHNAARAAARLAILYRLADDLMLQRKVAEALVGADD